MSKTTGAVLSITAFCLILPANLNAVQNENAQGDEKQKTKRVQSITDEARFHGMNCMDVSPDGRFLYASAWRSSSVSIFDIEGMTGNLERVDTFQNESMHGNSSVRVSPDGNWAAVACGLGKRVLLLERDPETGKLELAHEHLATTETTGERMFNDAVFSPNSKFLAVGGMRSSDETGALSIFRVNANEGTLEWLQTIAGPEQEIVDVRSLEFSEDGKMLVVAATLDSRLVVLDCDPESGKVRVRQVLQNDDEIKCLRYVFGVRISPDGRYVYTTSGRTTESFGMGVFGISDEGHFELIQQFEGDEPGLEGVLGGNELEVSHHGKYVATTLTDSREVGVFERDAKTGKLTLLARIQEPEDELFTPAGLAIGRNFRTRIIFSSEDSKRLLVYEIVDSDEDE